MRPTPLVRTIALGSVLSCATGAAPPPATTPAPAPPTRDPNARRVQVGPGAGGLPGLPNPGLPPAAAIPGNMPASGAAAETAGQPLSLQAALYGAITSNPDLGTLRQGTANGPSPEAVEVARRFPVALNPTVFIDYRPITLVPNGTFANSPVTGSGAGAANGGHHGYYHNGQQYIVASLRQPIELGHQTTHRYNIARAALDQQRWTILQAELTTLVQTYRFFQTAAYRREKYRLARELAEFNDRTLAALQRRQEANQAQPADVTLARVESRATRQQIRAARQDYLTALTDLRNTVGIPATSAAAEPLGEFTLPPYIPTIDEQAMVQTALRYRPDIHAAQAQVAGAGSAVNLAKGDTIPSPVVGPQYVQDEAGIQYIGLVYVTPIPILNGGKPLVRQRQAEHARAVAALRQAQQRAASQVRAAVDRWNGARELVGETAGLSGDLARDVASLQRLFEAGQTDLTKLMQARQRLIQLENARLDAVWAATQAQADLLLALGAPILIDAMVNKATADAAPAARPAAPTAAPAPAPAARPAADADAAPAPRPASPEPVSAP